MALLTAGVPAEPCVPVAVAGCDGLVGLTGLGVAGDETGALPVGACRLVLAVGERVTPAEPASTGCAGLTVPLVGLAVGLVGTIADAGFTGLVGALAGPVLAAGIVAMPVALVAAPFGLVEIGAAGTGVVEGVVPAAPGMMPAELAELDPAMGVLAIPLAGVGEATGLVEPVDA
ncbi:hypothetical protein MKL09_04320 [Methylobacterium sp. J-048]|uniref:hypothetical protein n=1 Tax=Methylobacterium sp. J-048 TaxID=2836635 RepID=UPI001FBB2C54|nr:hypothetical protein [Methylobacterium sp. J-048]MCJ2055772.1 hypothetical protein [Methylobacterium sp. J-048]